MKWDILLHRSRDNALLISKSDFLDIFFTVEFS